MREKNDKKNTRIGIENLYKFQHYPPTKKYFYALAYCLHLCL